MMTAEAQVTISDVTLPATMKAADSELILNGGGLREKLWIDLYVGGLYMESKSSDAKSIVDADKAMAVKLEIVSKLITSDKMADAINEGFEKSTGGNMAPLQSKISKFIETFKKEEITEGNVFDIIYISGTGVQTYKGGKLQSTIEGLNFKKALFAIWLGSEPADKNLKKGMLGN